MRLADEFADRIEIVWHAYLLRPEAKPDRDPEKFRRYTEGWKVPAAEPDSGDFRPWSSAASPPSHSIPPHRAAKAAARVGPEAFRRLHDRLMRAYFNESRDISSDDVLRELWLEVGLPATAFERAHDDAILDEVLRDHSEARRLGANGVPAIRRVDSDAVVVGAHPEALYRRWIERSLERGEGLVDVSDAGRGAVDASRSDESPSGA